MPLTQEQKDYILQAKGFNPQEYDFDDTTKAIKRKTLTNPVMSEPRLPVNNSAPVVAPTQQPSAPKMSGTEAFGVQAGRSALPATTGLLTAVALAPFTEGLSLVPSLAAMIGGPALTSWGISKLQEPTLKGTQFSAERAVQAQQQQPLAYLAGAVAPNLLTFKPSLGLAGQAGPITAIKSAARALGAGQRLASQEVANIANVGIGAALPVATQLGQAGIEKAAGLSPEINVRDMLAEAALGAIVSNPNRLGQKLGFHALEGQILPDRLRGMSPATLTGKMATGDIRPEQTIAKSVKREGVVYPPTIEDAIALQSLAANRQPSRLRIQQEEAPRLVGDASVLPNEAVLNTLQADTAQRIPVDEAGLIASQIQTRQQDYQRAIAEKQQADLELADLQAFKAQRDAILAKQQAQEAKASIQFLEQNYPTLPKNSQYVEPTPSVDLRQLNKRMRENTISTEEAKYQPKEGEKPSNALKMVEESTQLKPIEEVPQEVSNVPAGLVKAMKTLGVDRGVQVDTTSGKLYMPDGTEVNGKAYVEEGARKVLSSLQSNDLSTLPHEILHHFYDDLKKSDLTSERALSRRIEERVSASPEFAAYKAKYPSRDVEEFLVQGSGEETIRAIQQGDQSLWKDIVSGVKTRFSRNPKIEDIQRYFSGKLLRDAPYNETFGRNLLKTSTTSSTAKTQPLQEGQENVSQERTKGEATPAKDLSQLASEYELNQAKMKALMDNERAFGEDGNFTPEFTELFRRNEEIKNQNEGRVPVKEDAKGQPTEEPKEEVKKTKLAGEDLELKPTNKRYGFLRAAESQFDKVKSLVDEELGKALHRASGEKDLLLGKYRNTVQEAISRYSTKELDNVVTYRRAKFRKTGEVPELTGREQQLNDLLGEFLSSIRDEQIAAKLEIKGREAGKNEDYIPDMMSEKAFRLFIEKPNSTETIALKREWRDYLAEHIGEEKATQQVNDYVRAVSSDHLSTTEFNALRKPMGYGLPEGLREINGAKVLSKYFERAATDLAFFKHVESDPNVAKVLENTKGMPEVKGALKWINGNFEQSSPLLTASSRVVNNMLMGIATGARDIATIPALFAPYMHNIRDLTLLGKAFTRLGEARRNALKTNATRHNLDLNQWSKGESESGSAWTDNLNKLADAARKWQGRELVEQGGRIYTYALGEELAKVNLQRHLAGDKEGTQFIEQMGGEGLVKPEDIRNLEDVTEEVVQKLAKGFVDRVQGTYGGRGLPSSINEGALAPFLALSKWSVEKSNVVWKDVIQPMQEGNFKPFLLYTLGTLFTGAGIRELNELMSNRKDQNASLKEALVAGDKLDQAAAIINLMQQGSYAGIVGDATKAASDILVKKQLPRGLSFPLVDFASQTVAKNLADWNAALDQGEPLVDTTLALAQKMITDSVQNARLLRNQMEPEEMARKDHFRDLRVYKQLAENQPSSSVPEANPFLNKRELAFKRESNMEEAVKELGDILRDYSSKYANDPEKFKKKLQSLKQNSYQTMPSLENDLPKFASYYQYLLETQGEEKAKKIVQDYMEQNQKNKVKSSLVPSL